MNKEKKRTKKDSEMIRIFYIISTPNICKRIWLKNIMLKTKLLPNDRSKGLIKAKIMTKGGKER
jgi:hypothetical protein